MLLPPAKEFSRLNNYTEEQIKGEISDGQESVFGTMWMPEREFYVTESKELRSISRRNRIQSDLIDEIVQETWLYAFVHRRQFRGNCAPELHSWLEKILHSKTMDALRRRKRCPRESPNPILGEQFDRGKVDDFADGRSLFEQMEMATWLLAELRRKQPLHCWMLLQHYLHERSLQELAEEKGLTIHAVRNRISRAIKKLRHGVRRAD